MRTAIAAVALLLLAGCTSSNTSSTGSDDDPYQQTWTVSYKETTCAQWLDEMTDREQFVAAHDFIVALNANDQSDSFARTYQSDITKDCQPAPVLKLSEVAAALATLDTDDFPR